MAFETGTATDAEDLFTRLKTFLTTSVELAAEVPTQVWAVEEDTTIVDGAGNNDRELYLRGPGLAGTDAIHVNLNLVKVPSAGSDAWSIKIRGATSYNAGLTLNAQPGVSPFEKTMPLFDAAMPYWFFGNGRRFIVIAQVTGSVYTNMYCGFILPFAPNVSALDYTYPLYIGASMCNTSLRFSNTGNLTHRAFWNPCSKGSLIGGGAIYSPNNFWREIANDDDVTFATQVTGYVEPYADIWLASELQATNTERLLGGDYLLTECLLSYPTSNIGLRERYGVLDGVAHVSGVSQSSQNTLTVGADTWLVIQQGFQTGQEHFVALKQ